MSDLIWLIFILLVVVLAVSVLWLVWRLRHFSHSQNQTVIDDKLLQNMLGDDALSKDLKSALVGKTKIAGTPQATSADAEGERQADPDKKRGTEQQSSGQER
ncbi:MAG: hypothetical protein D3910_08645 [Candidatus Electrothrix sp. ATG2]|nr:hypothetical protein [Candidatus Electrothrix sp. ATG2]